MTQAQKIIKYAAIGLAVLLIVSMIAGIVTIASYLLSGGGISETVETVEIEGEIRSLEIDLEATNLTVKDGEAFKVETNNSYLVFENDEGTLSVEEKRHRVFGDKYEAELILTVPAGTVFGNVEINAGAGKVRIETLSADNVDFEFGAGEADIDALFVSGSADIDGGAGSIKIGSGSIAALDLDMGVGELTLHSALLGTNEINCGVGSVELALIGSEADYSVEIFKGLGAVTVNGEHLHDGETVGSGVNKLRVSGGVGEIRVTFGSN